MVAAGPEKPGGQVRIDHIIKEHRAKIKKSTAVL